MFPDSYLNQQMSGNKSYGLTKGAYPPPCIHTTTGSPTADLISGMNTLENGLISYMPGARINIQVYSRNKQSSDVDPTSRLSDRWGG